MKFYFYYPNIDNAEIEFWTLEKIGLIGWDSEFSVSFASPDECVNYTPSCLINFDVFDKLFYPSSFAELEAKGYADILTGYYPLGDEWKCGEPYGKYLGKRIYF
ncbi:hypothetical protein [Bartonella sp. HY761]|uniref:hypothetical protein n=1 Tax=Bartonella sp. HY761 TaxID=2979330 RepID=UPI00220BD64D|nr:hypothetical protein [Bartonella sp. HY761]UXN06401.1 hypothetical protein N6A79_14300 [Bartonella sp. HY761]